MHRDRYRHLSKLEVFAVAEEFGWLCTDQRTVPEGWAVDFVRVSVAKTVWTGAHHRRNSPQAA